MTTLLDTDTLVDVLRGHEPALKWFASLESRLGVPGFVAMELYSGCRDAREARAVRSLLSPLEIVWPSRAAMGSVLRDFPRNALRHGIGVLDALVAQTALEEGAVLFTVNLRHYRGIEGLAAQEPYSR